MAAAGGAAAVVSVTGAALADEPAAIEPKTDQKGSQYKVTPHISTYYKKARI
jgi:hypothetical protein